MKVMCAAIQYIDPRTGNKCTVVGPNHGYCIEHLSMLDQEKGYEYLRTRNKSLDEQGFMISTPDGLEFADRKKAYDVAKKAGQLIREMANGLLDSYNVNYATKP